jgi:hypothetical protein
MSNSIHTPPSRLPSEPLHGSIGAVYLHPRRARSEATPSCYARPRSPPPCCARASPENQLSQEGHLHTGRGVADEHGVVGPEQNPYHFFQRADRHHQMSGKQVREFGLAWRLGQSAYWKYQVWYLRSHLIVVRDVALEDRSE